MKKEKTHILLIEDNPLDARLVKEYLNEYTSFPYELTTAATLAHGLSGLNDGSFDVILLDLNLPDSTGMATFQKIFSASPHIPIVLLTGINDEALATHAIQLGAQDYLVKNQINSTVLVRTIQHSIQRKNAETALSKSENKYKLLFDDDLTGNIISSVAGDILLCNPAMATMLGFDSVAALMKLNITAFYRDPHDREKMLNLVREKKKISEYEQELLCRDGKIIWVVENLVGEFDATGKLISLKGYMFDITKRKIAEQRQNLTNRILAILNRSNEWQQLIKDILVEIKQFTGFEAVGIRMKKGQDYPYFETNGFTSEFVEMENFLCSRDSQGKLRHQTNGKPCLECLCGTVISGCADSSFPWFTKGGSYWTNNTTNFIKTADIDNLQIITRNHCNAEGYESVALIPLKSENEIIGLLQLNDKRRDSFTADMIHFFEDIGASIAIAFKNMQAAEELVKAKEKAEESDRLKTAFLANMSHEIRTPMNGILGFATLLKEPGLSGEEQQEYISVIEKSGDRMLNIINDIICISMLESGQMEVQIAETNVIEQINYVFTFLKPEADLKGLQLRIEKMPPIAEARIKTDREKLYAILTKLIGNAIKYTPHGTISFGCTKQGTELEFYVKDTGFGIAPERQKAVFERFIQADIEDRNATQGAGLGLSIAKSYVEMLGGKIHLHSQEGQGSTFRFTLPVDALTKSRTVKETQIQKVKNVPLTKKIKILIVEDDEASMLLLQITLESPRHQILTAGNGLEAVEMCRRNPDIDLVLMDIRMPEMDGYEATRQIRLFNQKVMVVAQTAYALSSDREKALASGCNAFLKKPVKKNQLLNLVKSTFAN